MKDQSISKRISIAIYTFALVFLSAQSSSFPDNIYTSNSDLDKARYSLLSHLNTLEKQYSELNKNYQNYMELAGQTSKQMDLIESAIKQDKEVLRRIEDALRSQP